MNLIVISTLVLVLLVSTQNLYGQDYSSVRNNVVSHCELMTISEEGWITDSNGKTYIRSDGTKYYNSFVEIEEKTYYFKDDGYVATGWTKIDGFSYFFRTNGDVGQMLTGWLTLNSQKFYLGSDGRMRTGWQTIDGKKYYFWLSGSAATGWQKIGGYSYFFLTQGNIGQMMTGWINLNGYSFYLDSDGRMQTGWQMIGGKKYYFWTSGAMAVGWCTVEGSKYYFGETEAHKGQLMTGWLHINSTTYYLGSDGRMRTGWQIINGKTYYFWSGGSMATGWCTIDGPKYYFGETEVHRGQMMTGWLNLNGNMYYLGTSGIMSTGWAHVARENYYMKLDGIWQKYWNYFGSDGILKTDSDVSGCNHGNNIFNESGIIYKFNTLRYTCSVTNQNVQAAVSWAAQKMSNVSGINIQKAESSSQAHIWFTLDDQLDEGVVASTYFYKGGNRIRPYQEDKSWDQVIIHINVDYMNHSVLPNALLHEICHGLDLSHHISNEDTIMGRFVSVENNYLHSVDIKNLNHVMK